MLAVLLLASSFVIQSTASECLYEVGICNPFNSWIDQGDGSDGVGFWNQYSTVCECQGTTEVCTTFYDSLLCEKAQFTASDVWLTQSESPCCATTKAPDNGCCYGTVAKCDTNERSVCQKASKCEWRAGQDADCTVTTTKAPTSEPGCCYGADSKCDIDDSAKCSQRARKYGCEWRSGHDADCTFVSTAEPEPVSGCCYGADEKCDTDDSEVCEKRARRYGCEWKDGEDADCTVVTTEPTEPTEPSIGCCHGSSSRCDVGDDESLCKQRSGRAGCQWITTGHDLLCDVAREDEAVMAVMNGAEVESLTTRERMSVDGWVLLASAVLIAWATHRWCFSRGAKQWATESQPLLTV